MFPTRPPLPTGIALACLACLVAPANAQQPAPAAAGTTPQSGAPPLPDIEFAADVHMDALRVRSTPSARVEFHGGPRLDTRHDVEREGLPTPLVPGRYRDAGVRVTISASVIDPLSLLDAAPAASSPTPADKDPQ